MSRPIQGTVTLPGSKSESNRALMIAAYGGFPLEIDGLSDAHDTVLLQTLLSNKEEIIDCQDAGTVARFLLTYLSNKPGNRLLTGTSRLCERPMAPLVDALRHLGAVIDGYDLPLHIEGATISGGSVTLDASQSSQFASSLLLAAPTWERGLQLSLSGAPVSMPYLEMTIKMMQHFGIQIERNGNVITVAHQDYQVRPFTVSADWSAASYWYELLAVSDGGELLLKGLTEPSLQGDAVVAEWFKAFGVDTFFESQGARLVKRGAASIPQGLVFDFTDHPDLFPAVYATSFALGVEAEFKGTETLAAKESDRYNALKTELARIPKDFSLPMPVFSTYGDHRIAMSLAALKPLLGSIVVDDSVVVNKSYPGFWEELESL